MDTIFTLGDVESDDIRLNMDDLYEKKKQQDLNTLTTYNRLLNRIHNKIKNLSRMKADNQFCWYLIPEIIIGVPKYDHIACTAYIIDKLKDNGFITKYTHPNLLFISWKHWVPSYVRNEIKKKTGIIVDGYGKKLDKTDAASINNQNPDTIMYDKLKQKSKFNGNVNFNDDSNGKSSNGTNSNYKEIDSYKPSGNLVYNNNLFKKIFDKTT